MEKRPFIDDLPMPVKLDNFHSYLGVPEGTQINFTPRVVKIYMAVPFQAVLAVQAPWVSAQRGLHRQNSRRQWTSDICFLRGADKRINSTNLLTPAGIPSKE